MEAEREGNAIEKHVISGWQGITKNANAQAGGEIQTTRIVNREGWLMKDFDYGLDDNIDFGEPGTVSHWW